jgi:putative addiction module CopG family antidote
MRVSLKPELRRFVEKQVKAGRYATLEEVLEAGVARLMLDDPAGELDDATLEAIDRAETQLDRGQGIPVDQAFARLRKKHAPASRRRR